MLILNIYFILIIVYRLYISQSRNIYYPFKYCINISSIRILYKPVFRNKFKEYFFQPLIANKNKEPYQAITAHCLNKNGFYIKWEISQNIKNSRNTEIYTIYKCIGENKFSSYSYMKNKKQYLNDCDKLFKYKDFFFYLNYGEEFSMFTNENKYFCKDTCENTYSYYKNEKIFNKNFSFSSKKLMDNNKKVCVFKSSEFKFFTLNNNNNDKILHINNGDNSNKNYKRYKKRKFLSNSEIILTIKGNNTQQILNNKNSEIFDYGNNWKLNYLFNDFPSEILVNGNKIDIIDFYVHDLKLEENNITIRFNKSLSNCNVMFYGLSNITTIIFNNFDFSQVTSVKGIFYGCSNLISLYFSKSNISSITDISYMFHGCSNLRKLDLRNFIPSSIIDMKAMFYNCKNLISLDLYHFDTSSVFDMSYIFQNCHNLISLYINNINVSSLIYMGYMFYNCYNLITLNLSNFNTSSVLYMDHMFYNCSNLISLDISNFNTSSVISMNYMFYNCSKLISLDLTNFENSSLKTYNKIFTLCNSNLIFCIENINSKNEFFIAQIETVIANNINNCSDICFFNNKKIIYDDRICSFNCPDTDKFNYNNLCYKSCPSDTFINFGKCVSNCTNGYYTNKNDSSVKICKCINPKCFECSLKSLESDLCISCNDDYYPIYNDSSNIYPFINCYKSPEGFYFDKIEKNYKPCYPSCKACKEKGDIKDNKCLKCSLNYQFKNEFPNDTNCYEECKDYYYFDNEKNYYCVNECPETYNKIIEEKKKCIDDCSKDDIYKYYFKKKCYSKCPEKTKSNNYYCEKECPEDLPYEIVKTQICVKNCTFNNMIQNICILDNKNGEKNEKLQQELISNIQDYIMNKQSHTLNITNGEDIVINENGISLTITTTENQKNGKNNNVTTIDLGECEDKIKSHYEIPKDKPLIIIKIDVLEKGMKIPKIEYEIYYPLHNESYEKLNLSVCKDSKIDISIPVSIDESEIDKYNSSSSYYNDICYPYISENGTDITLSDRKTKFVENNYTLCEENCDFTGYDSNTKKALCSCQIKIKLPLISEIRIDKNRFFDSFTNFKNIANMNVLKCYNVLFTKNGILKNIGFYIIISIILLHFISVFIFYLRDLTIIKLQINEIVYRN